MSPERKKRIALQAITHQKTVTQLAEENSTRRKFIRQQGEHVQQAIDNIFDLNRARKD